MKYRDLKLMPSKFINDYKPSQQHLAKWREDVSGPLCVLHAVRELLSCSEGSPSIIKFAIGGHPTDPEGGNIEQIVAIGLSDDPELCCKLRYCGDNDNPMGAGSSGVAVYSYDEAENAMVILHNMPKGNIYRLAV